jgi:neutral ceramidase
MRALLFLLAIPLCAADLRVGAGAVRITPPMGAPMAGYYSNRGAEGTHDDLWAKAIVLEKDGTLAALVACDLIGMPRGIVEAARTQIAAATGIPGAQIMISATHAHTGPVLVDGTLSRYNLEGRMAEIAREYSAALPGRLAEAVVQAHRSLRPARVATATGREDSVSFNRRFFMVDGTVGWNAGKLNPRIVRPAGPIDPALPLVWFETADGKPLAAYVNFALHLDTVGGMLFSADYPYTIASQLAAVKGPDLLTMFTIGTAGNLNHIDVKTKEPQKGHGEAARIGTVLAAEVLKSLRHTGPVAAGALRVSSEMVKLPLAPIQPGEVEKAREIATRFGKPNAAPFLEQVQAFKVLDVAARNGQAIEAEVQVITLGDQLAWVGLPGEIFVELGTAIKTASPFPQTIVAELANGSISYVPNREAYPQGNYEVVSARCAEGGGEMLVDSALRQLRAAYRTGAR